MTTPEVFAELDPPPRLLMGPGPVGVDPRVQGDYALERGADIDTPERLVASERFLAAIHARVGDTIDVAARYDPQLRVFGGRRAVVISGVGRFYFAATGEPMAALPIATLQAMQGASGTDRVAAFMARVRPGVSVEAVRRDLARIRFDPE